MGMWDLQPYDNDSAADLFGDLMDKTKLREQWHALISDKGVFDEPEELRALVWLFIQLGHVYVWPIDHYEQDLELAIKGAEAVVNDEDFAEIEGLKDILQKEYDELLGRRKIG